MSDGRYYLSDQDLRDRLAEMPGDPDASTSCETYPPCGGCDGCIAAQQVYYFYREREWARRVHEAGLELADPSVIDRLSISKAVGTFGGWGPYHGEGGYHCWCAKELDTPVFPWNVRSRDG